MPSACTGWAGCVRALGEQMLASKLTSGPFCHAVSLSNNDDVYMLHAAYSGDAEPGDRETWACRVDLRIAIGSRARPRLPILLFAMRSPAVRRVQKPVNQGERDERFPAVRLN